MIIDTKKIGKRIKELRESLGLNQNDFSAALGYKRALISRVELGDILPSINLLINLQKNFKISIDFLITGKGPQKTTILPDDNDMIYLIEYCTKNQKVKHAILSFFFEYLEREQESDSKDNKKSKRGGK